MAIQVEFYGIPRLRAGTHATSVEVVGGGMNLCDVLHEVSRRFPAFAAECFDGEQLRSGFSANLCGTRFLTDPATPLRDGDSLLLLSADAGG